LAVCYSANVQEICERFLTKNVQVVQAVPGADAVSTLHRTVFQQKYSWKTSAFRNDRIQK